MDVHVHSGGINFKEQAADRITALHKRIVIAFDERVVDAAIFHRSTVHEHKLALAGRAGNSGRTDQTPNADFGFGSAGFRFFGRGVFKDVGFIRRGGIAVVIERGGEIHGQELFVAEQGAETFAQGFDAAGNDAFALDGGQLPDVAAVFDKRESDFGKSQRGKREIMLDVRGFGFLGAEKFPARGQIVKKLPDFKAAAGRAAGGFDLGDGAAVDNDLRAFG